MQPESIDNRTDRTLAECLRLDRPVAVLGYDYANGDSIPMHEHDKSQLIYAVEGTMVVTAQDGRWVLLPTRAVWVPAHTRHSIRMRSAVQMRTVYLDSSVFPPSTTCAVVSVSPLLRELILAMQKVPRRYSAASRGAHLAALLCDELRLSTALPLHLPWPKEPRLRKLCEQIQRRPNLAASLELCAADMGVSSRTLSRLFKREVGMGFQEWRLKLLLLEAQIRLAQGHSSSRVAKSLGYDSHAAFCAMFRKALGVAPTRYFERP